MPTTSSVIVVAYSLSIGSEEVTKVETALRGFTDVTSNLGSNAAFPGGITDGGPIESHPDPIVAYCSGMVAK